VNWTSHVLLALMKIRAYGSNSIHFNFLCFRKHCSNKFTWCFHKQKVLIRVGYFGARIFKFAFFIKYFYFWSVCMWANANRQDNFKTSKQCDVSIVWLWKCQKWILKAMSTNTRGFDVIYPATGAPYWPSIVRGHARAIQNKYFYSPYSNETFYTKAAWMQSILLI
jgi:hypothetical protein